MNKSGLAELLEGVAPPILEADERAEIFAKALSLSDPQERFASTVEHDLRRHRRQRSQHLALTAAMVILLAAGVAIVLPRHGLTGPTTTPYRAARPLSAPPKGSLPSVAVSGSWELVGDVVQAGWQQDTAGPPPADLTCPTNTDCYALAVKHNSGDHDTPMAQALYVSSDFGGSWSVLPVPSGFSPNTLLTCADGSTCAASGTVNGQAVLAETVDSGHQWTVTPLSGFPGEALLLSCSSAVHCVGISGPPSAIPGFQPGITPLAPGEDPGEDVIVTSDGGATWNSTPLPVQDLAKGMTCADTDHCVVVGHVNQDVRAVDAPSFSEVTTDGGSTWTVGSVPAGFDFLGPSAISCGDANHCQAIGSIELHVTNPPGQCQPGNGPPLNAAGRALEAIPTSTTIPSAGVQAIAAGEAALTQQTNDQSMTSNGGGFCTSDDSTLVNDLAATTDGGLTWTPEVLPLDVPEPSITNLACSDANTCWAGGSEAVTVQIGNVSDGGSAVLLGTKDGGMTWSKVTFAVPANAPNFDGQSYQSVGSISCPDSGECLALGVAAEGSPTTPVYRYSSGG